MNQKMALRGVCCAAALLFLLIGTAAPAAACGDPERLREMMDRKGAVSLPDGVDGRA